MVLEYLLIITTIIVFINILNSCFCFIILCTFHFIIFCIFIYFLFNFYLNFCSIWLIFYRNVYLYGAQHMTCMKKKKANRVHSIIICYLILLNCVQNLLTCSLVLIKSHAQYTFPCSCGSVVEHCVSSAKVVGSILREHTYKTCITRMHCKLLWIKASAKCINVNNLFPQFDSTKTWPRFSKMRETFCISWTQFRKTRELLMSCAQLYFFTLHITCRAPHISVSCQYIFN